MIGNFTQHYLQFCCFNQFWYLKIKRPIIEPLSVPVNNCNSSGRCSYQFSVRPCVIYTIRTRSKEQPLKLLIESKVFSSLILSFNFNQICFPAPDMTDFSAKGTSEGKPEIILTWLSSCPDTNVTNPFSISIKDEANSYYKIYFNI